VNLHQIPVNCPFMSGSLSSLNFDGAMRVDGNHSSNKQAAPNSFMGDRFRPDVAEAPYKVSDNVVSRKSHYYHEGKMSEYDQPRDLYRNVMTEQARKNLHHNTAKMLSHVNFPMIQQQYLAQIYNIAPEYARGVFDLTKFKHKQPFEFSEVEAMSEQAPLFFKVCCRPIRYIRWLADFAAQNVKFRPSQGNRLVGFAPDAPFYNV